MSSNPEHHDVTKGWLFFQDYPSSWILASKCPLRGFFFYALLFDDDDDGAMTVFGRPQVNAQTAKRKENHTGKQTKGKEKKQKPREENNKTDRLENGKTKAAKGKNERKPYELSG